MIRLYAPISIFPVVKVNTPETEVAIPKVAPPAPLILRLLNVVELVPLIV